MCLEHSRGINLKIMVSHGIVVVVAILTAVFDLFTLPFFAIFQWPCGKIKRTNEDRAHIVSRKGRKSVTYEALPMKSNIVSLLKEMPGEESFGKLFNFMRKTYGNEKCIGTRSPKYVDKKIDLESGEEPMKFALDAPYEWRTYCQFCDQVMYFGRGMESLGQEKGNNIILFGDTCPEWLIASYGCLSFGLVVVTAYTKIGETLINRVISETAASTVIVSEQQLNGLCETWKEFGMAPSVSSVIVMEEHLTTANRQAINYLEDVEMCSVRTFKEVIDKGKKRKKTKQPNILATDTAMIVYTSGTLGDPLGTVLTHKNMFYAAIGTLHWYEHSIGKQGDTC